MMKNNVKYLVGSDEFDISPSIPYSDLACEFLDDLSRELRQDKQAKKFSDIMSFAFWCRKSNVISLKQKYESKNLRIGRGLAFHIAPSNVPINFAFSFAFGLLSGNANIVRVSTKEFEQVTIICDILKKVFLYEKYQILQSQNAIISYEIDKVITDYFSSICDARIIWGGDNTVSQIRESKTSARCVEITFADRLSFGVINPDTVIGLDDKELNNLAEKFYNDTYLMDQNACSSPHLIIWKSEDQSKIHKATKLFWNSVYQVAKKYDLVDIKVVDKYTMVCESLAMMDSIKHVERYENVLYVLTLSTLPHSINDLRGKYGMFYEYNISKLDSIAALVDNKIQTLVYYGIEKNEFEQFIIKNHLRGIDRIVPVGNALDISVIWDGYDVISNLTRIIG